MNNNVSGINRYLFFVVVLTYFNGKDFFRILFTRPTVALNSSGATRDCRPAGKFVLKLLLKPKLKN